MTQPAQQLVASVLSIPAGVQLLAKLPAPPLPVPAQAVRVLQDDEMPPDPLDPAERARLDRLLLRYMERDEEDLRNGRTREHHEKMLQRVIDEQARQREATAKRDGLVDNQFTELRVRQAGLETTVGKLDSRVEKLEGKIEDVAETTGNFRIEDAEGRAKRSEKWWFLVGGALVATALTIAGDLVIRSLTHDQAAPPVHVEPPGK